MPIRNDQKLIIEQFVQRADFRSGALILDLDGTALYEDRGKVFISGSVENGIKEIVAMGRPVVLNTLRFPLSVINTVAQEWMSITGDRIPAILLNGSLLGYIERKEESLCFVEIASFPLQKYEVEVLIFQLRELLENEIRDIALFYYPRDWKKGEVIWVPDEHRIAPLREKYVSASVVVTTSLEELLGNMIRDDTCMALVLVDRPRDMLMAYQHKEPSMFLTRDGIDKTFGTKEMAKILGISLPDSAGAGDTRMDRFLSDVGLAIIVGDDDLPYKGIRETLRAHDPIELGQVISNLAEYARSKSNL